MQLTIKKQDLMKALGRCKSVASERSTMPILGKVLLIAEGETLVCKSTDLTMATTSSVPAEVKKPGSLAVNAAALLERVRHMPDGDLSLTVKDTAISVQSKGHARKFVLTGLPAEDFPDLPSSDGPSGTSLDSAALAKAIDATIFAVSTDETRLHLASAFVRLNGKGTIAATDGHRLAVAEFQSDAPAADMLIPRRALLEMRRLCEDAEALALTYGGSHLHVTADGTTLSLKLTDAKFPPYQQVIPKLRPAPLLANRADLLNAIKAVAVAASDKTGGIKCALSKGKLALSTSTADGGDGADELDVEYSGEAHTVGLNSKYVVDVLGALDCESVGIEVIGELDPVVITPAGATDYTAVVMPMRI